MSRPSAAIAPRDPLRALFLCLMVLAQLLASPIFEQARAANGCVGLSSIAPDAGKASKQIPHAHNQECAHCRPQAAVPAAPIPHPEIAVAPAFETAIAHGEASAVATPQKPIPPATGPPVAGSGV